MNILQSQDVHKKHFLSFDVEKHAYTLDGNPVPGATDIKLAYPKSFVLQQWDKGETAKYVVEWFRQRGAKPWPTDAEIKAVLTEAKTASKKTLDATASIGSLMHDYAHSKRLKIPFTQWERVNAHPDYETIIKRFGEVDAWVKEREQEEEVIKAEFLVASPKHQYAGTGDVLVMRNGKIRLQDYKSSKGFYIDQFLQEGLYSTALLEWDGIKVDEFEVVRFHDNTEKPASLVISRPSEIKALEKQALIVRKTRAFQKQWEETDKRFKFIRKKK